MCSGRWTVWFQPVAGGLIVGLTAWFVPQVLGVGYAYVGDAINGRLGLELMALLIVVKVLCVTVSYGSGNAGGIFAPSLFIGAMLGGSVGTVAHRFLPAHTALPGAYALVGMGTLFAGIVRAPMTSVMMIFETTRDYSIIVPLMISNLLSFYISLKLQRHPIYEELAQQDGIHLPARMEERKVIGVMRTTVETLSARLTVGEALGQIRGSQLHSWIVVNEKDVLGIIPHSALQQALADGAGDERVGSLTLSLIHEHVHKDQPLHIALERMGSAGVDVLAVVSRANILNLEGIVTLGDILKSYGISGLQDQIGAFHQTE
jgi:CIC family chloride channel protein